MAGTSLECPSTERSGRQRNRSARQSPSSDEAVSVRRRRAAGRGDTVAGIRGPCGDLRLDYPPYPKQVVRDAAGHVAAAHQESALEVALQSVAGQVGAADEGGAPVND